MVFWLALSDKRSFIKQKRKSVVTQSIVRKTKEERQAANRYLLLWKFSLSLYKVRMPFLYDMYFLFLYVNMYHAEFGFLNFTG